MGPNVTCPSVKGHRGNEDANYQCGHCDKRFNTQRGLSQHERHEHPAARNGARLVAATTKERQKPKGFGSNWSKEELDKMLQMEIEFCGEKYIARRMTYPGKLTNKSETRGRKQRIADSCVNYWTRARLQRSEKTSREAKRKV